MEKAGGSVEPYTLNSSAGNSAPVGGRRRHSKKHMKKVSASTIKRTLRRLGMKPKGRVVIKGGVIDPKTGEDIPEEGGRRHSKRHSKRHTKRHRKTRSLFGMRGLRY